jgi:SET domain-containing protein
MLLVKTKIGQSAIHGMGLFAAEPIPKGTVIWRFDHRIDHLLNRESVESLPEVAREHVLRYCGLLENGKYLQTGDHDRFINHSAEPNTISRPFLEDLTAARDIAEGEEITEDYRVFDFSEERLAYTT